MYGTSVLVIEVHVITLTHVLNKQTTKDKMHSYWWGQKIFLCYDYFENRIGYKVQKPSGAIDYLW